MTLSYLEWLFPHPALSLQLLSLLLFVMFLVCCLHLICYLCAGFLVDPQGGYCFASVCLLDDFIVLSVCLSTESLRKLQINFSEIFISHQPHSCLFVYVPVMISCKQDILNINLWIFAKLAADTPSVLPGNC